MSLCGELKRRNVFRVRAAYVVAAWLVIQDVDRSQSIATHAGCSPENAAVVSDR